MQASLNSYTSNIFLYVFARFWGIFKLKTPSFDTEHVNKQIESILRCGDPKFGFSQYMCLHCVQDGKVVAHSCKSKFCLRCGRVEGENFAASIANKLHQDVDYRHMTLTIPSQYRNIFYENRYDPDFWNNFFQLGWEFVKEMMREITGLDLECGCLIVLHTVGRKCDYKPHLHVMLMSGGITPDGNWLSLGYFDYSILCRLWKKVLLAGMRKWDKEGKHEDVFRETEKYVGFYTNLDSNPAPRKRRALIRYLSKYLCRPQISLKRILGFSEKTKEIVYKYQSHETGKVELERCGVLTFVERMAQQILPYRFKRIRYYGLQAPSNRSRLTAKVCKALGKLELHEEVDRRSVAPMRLSYQELLQIWWNENPFVCRNCGHLMEVVRIWKDGKGWVYNIFERIFGADIGPPGVLPDFFKSLDNPLYAQ
ncbi:MAG: hypothetical protein D3907_01825 [Candidatus Electrothrix sp. AUS3]|nr:hypothetical protein [Candidatus Electrothrix gigas]